jgi:sugar lactone lactonase YvrE
MKIRREIAVLIISAFLLYFGFTKGPIDAAAYSPPKAPDLEGVLAPNNELKKAKLLGLGRIRGPEDVEVDKEGRVYAGTSDGKIARVLVDDTVEELANTHGRPLGLRFDSNDNLIVCDAFRGLLSVDKQGNVTVLASQAEGVRLNVTDDLDIASDGMIYFSDASTKYRLPDYPLDMLEARPYGRLLRYDPGKKKVKVLLKGLYFSNGVALSQNEDFVLVNETYRYRITRYWLKGPKAGRRDVFIDNLPGFPDNLASNRKGFFWVALFAARNLMADFIHPYPWIKNLVARLPSVLWSKQPSYGLVLEIDEAGKIVESLHDAEGRHLHAITSAKEVEGFLYLGSLDNDRIGKLRRTPRLK